MAAIKCHISAYVDAKILKATINRPFQTTVWNVVAINIGYLFLYVVDTAFVQLGFCQSAISLQSPTKTRSIKLVVPLCSSTQNALVTSRINCVLCGCLRLVLSQSARFPCPYRNAIVLCLHNSSVVHKKKTQTQYVHLVLMRNSLLLRSETPIFRYIVRDSRNDIVNTFYGYLLCVVCRRVVSLKRRQLATTSHIYRQQLNNNNIRLPLRNHGAATQTTVKIRHTQSAYSVCQAQRMMRLFVPICQLKSRTNESTKIIIGARGIRFFSITPQRPHFAPCGHSAAAVQLLWNSRLCRCPSEISRSEFV